MREHEITSEENPSFREWTQLTLPRGIRKHGRALLSGAKIVDEAWRTFPEQVDVLLLGGTRMSLPDGFPESMRVVRLPAPLFPKSREVPAVRGRNTIGRRSRERSRMPGQPVAVSRFRPLPQRQTAWPIFWS